MFFYMLSSLSLDYLIETLGNDNDFRLVDQILSQIYLDFNVLLLCLCLMYLISWRSQTVKNSLESYILLTLQLCCQGATFLVLLLRLCSYAVILVGSWERLQSFCSYALNSYNTRHCFSFPFFGRFPLFHFLIQSFYSYLMDTMDLLLLFILRRIF